MLCKLLEKYLHHIQNLEHYRTDFTPNIKFQIIQLHFRDAVALKFMILYLIIEMVIKGTNDYSE